MDSSTLHNISGGDVSHSLGDGPHHLGGGDDPHHLGGGVALIQLTGHLGEEVFE